jgi:hypothetical protein
MLTALIKFSTWLFDQGTLPENTDLSKEVLEGFSVGLKAKRQAFLREASLKRWQSGNESSSSGQVITEVDKLVASQDYEEALRFIEHCLRGLQEETNPSLYSLALTYLINQGLSAKTDALFTKFMELDEQNALAFYTKHKETLAKSPCCRGLVEETMAKNEDLAAVNEQLPVFEQLLQREQDLAGLIPLFKEKFGSIELASLVLVLLKHKVPADHFTNSILHDFFAHYLMDLGFPYPDNAIKRFYGMLAKFSEAEDLDYCRYQYPNLCWQLECIDKSLPLCESISALDKYGDKQTNQGRIYDFKIAKEITYELKELANRFVVLSFSENENNKEARILDIKNQLTNKLKEGRKKIRDDYTLRIFNNIEAEIGIGPAAKSGKVLRKVTSFFSNTKRQRPNKFFNSIEEVCNRHKPGQ